MLLSEMLELEQGVLFTVNGLSGVYQICTDIYGVERIDHINNTTNECEVVNNQVIWDIINVAPSGITQLPLPLTAEQKEQLKALYTLGYKWLTKDRGGKVHAYAQRRPSKQHPSAWGNGGLECIRILNDLPSGLVASLVSWNNNFPFDIGKALGVE